MKTVNRVITIEEFEELNPVFNEGLIRTVNVDKAHNMIRYRLRGNPCQIEDVKPDINSLYIQFLQNHRDSTEELDVNEFKNIISFIDNLGYTPSHYYSYGINMLKPKKYEYNEVIKILNDKDIGLYKIQFDAKFPPSIPCNKLPKKFYHMTDGSVKDKILKVGLSPRSHKKLEDHTDRIYFCLNNACLISLLKTSKFHRKSTSDKIVIFEIDGESLRKDRDIDFFEDPSLKNAIFTYSNIHPSYIKIVQEIDKSKLK